VNITTVHHGIDRTSKGNADSQPPFAAGRRGSTIDDARNTSIAWWITGSVAHAASGTTVTRTRAISPIRPPVFRPRSSADARFGRRRAPRRAHCHRLLPTVIRPQHRRSRRRKAMLSQWIRLRGIVAVVTERSTTTRSSSDGRRDRAVTLSGPQAAIVWSGPSSEREVLVSGTSEAGALTVTEFSRCAPSTVIAAVDGTLMAEGRWYSVLQTPDGKRHHDRQSAGGAAASTSGVASGSLGPQPGSS
jgi:hypothetical protein